MRSKIITENPIVVRVKKEHADVYEHLNNSCFSFYFERARKFILKRIGFDDEEFKARGIGLFVTKASYRYGEQVNVDEEIEINSEVRLYKARIIVNSVMCSETGEKAKAEIEHFFVNLKTGRPIRIPKDILESLAGD